MYVDVNLAKDLVALKVLWPQRTLRRPLPITIRTKDDYRIGAIWPQ